MGSTQFESLDARRAFPCWDEPAHKAVFAVSIEVAGGLDAVSNMPEKEVRHSQEGKTIVFMETPRMSTYLLAFIVGKFDAVASVTRSGIVTRVLSTPGRAEEGRFALDVAVRALEL